MDILFDGLGGYLAAHTELTVFLCLGLGYLAGRARIGSFRIGATVGTLLVSLLVGQLAPFSIADQLKSTFFIMFSFVLGYECGPAFFDNLRTSGLRAVLLALFYGAVTLSVVLAVCGVMGYDTGTAAGLMAGAQTQSSILGTVSGDADSSAAATVAYALTYIFGTVGTILFMKKIGPAMMGIDLRSAVKRKLDAQGAQGGLETVTMDAAIQVRAYRIEAVSVYAGQTVCAVEQGCAQCIQIVRLFRGGQETALRQDLPLLAGDVITVIGRTDCINAFDDKGLTEVSGAAYLQIEIASAELIVTMEDAASVSAILTRGGIVLRQVIRGGKRIMPDTAGDVLAGDHLLVTGPAAAIAHAASQIGYIRDTGDAADVGTFSLAIAAGVFVGSLSVSIGSIPLALGASGGALLLGLLCGWMYHRDPKRGYIPSGARWLVKSVGLNLFIAVTALNSAKALGPAIGLRCIPLLLAGAVVTLLPHVISVVFAQRVLKMDPVDTLGALCGSATCTAALNGLIEETDSTLFTGSYSPAYAVGNILLTVGGIVVSLVL